MHPGEEAFGLGVGSRLAVLYRASILAVRYYYARNNRQDRLMAIGRSRNGASDAFSRATGFGAIFFVAFLAAYFSSAHPPHDVFGNMIGADFVNDWLGARAALTGHVHKLFDFELYTKFRHALLPPMPMHNWSYPPDLLLFIWPYGILPYFSAFVLWCALGFAAYLGVACSGDRTKPYVVFLLFSPAVAMNLFAGQNGFFTAALLIGGFTMLDRRPLAAGTCFGLLTIKPHLGILIPLALILSRRWRVILAAAATFVVLFALTSAIFGLSVWTDYLRLAVPFQHRVLAHGKGLMLMMMPTAFTNARLMGFSSTVAFCVQLPFTLFAIAAVVWTFMKTRDPQLSCAILITAGFVATPYVFNYDMVVFGWLVWTLRERFSNSNDTRLMLLVWTLPVTVMVLGLVHLPGSALVLPAFLFRLVWMLARAEERPHIPAVPQAAAA